ncbi:trimeric intracellular cation channel family protein [Halorubrum sp. BOL3-1]|uniref:trimeric intracellular cation channel family protein n=1 Tax=Halorubrum sp. BOL3-1 TaxID=2497325 RepID=UPI0010051CD3|nr:TRIC cation channel family protein [Halorubrum sp. BOL3-1]QAU12102.1 trimeric intracellular cation channel family protein [Halorubrum sp. BOL3-1]
MTGGILTVLFGDPFAAMNTVGLVAFALVGASKAVREEFDLFGVAVVGLAMAFAGGVTRDLLVARVPLALRSPVEIILGLVGVALAVGLSAWLASPDEHPVTVVADAVGLAAFAATGAIVATDAGVSAFGVVAVATVNAVGGGALADILLDRAPFVLFEDFYASCAVAGGVAYWLAGTLGAPSGVAAAVCAALTVGLRLVAVARGWRLPTAKRLDERIGD